MAKKPRLGWLVKGQQFYLNLFPVPPQEDPSQPTLCEFCCITIDGKVQFDVVDLAANFAYEIPISDFAKMVDEGFIQVRTY